MEGLIPKLFKSFKKSKTLRQQHNPQSTPIHNIQDFYPDGYNLKYEIPPVQQQQQQQQQMVDGFDDANKFKQRRQKSFTNVQYVDGRYSSEETTDSSRQIVRFTSHRRMFSCITGA